MSTSTRVVIIAAALAAGTWACGPKEVAYNSNSGPDGVRDTATQLSLNTSEDDRCNADEGDHEDWRYMMIDKAGVLKVSVRVDNPRIDADVFLHDGFGRAIDRLNINESSDFYEFPEIEVPVGRYYFRIACKAGQSVYTVSASFAEPEKVAEPAAVYVVEAAPEPEPDPKPRRKKKKRDKKEPEPEKKPEKKPEPKVEAEPEPVVAALPPKKVEGTITLVTPGDGGKAKITIRGVGTKFGVDTSMKGKLKGKGKRVSLFSCEKTKCQGVIEADEEELKEFDTVVFEVPQE